MGAIMFFIAFILLIPVCSFIVDMAMRFDIIKPVSDPAEWDEAEETNRFTEVEGSGKKMGRAVNQ